MKRNILALVLVFCVILPVAVGCKKPSSEGSVSSAITSEEKANESLSAEAESETAKNNESSKVSTVSSSNEEEIIEEETSSSSQSQSVKVNRDGLKIGMYHMSMSWCDSYGTMFEEREKEFRENVEAGYFNTFFLSASDLGKGYLLKEIQIIAEHGYTFWLSMGNFHSSSDSDGLEDIEYHQSQLQLVIDAITKMGYRDNLMGMTWDEPIWNGQTNRDFLTQSELYYKKFGLRTFPVFALDEFAKEGDFNALSQQYGSVASEALKYVTDVGYDVYDVDVRLESEYVNGTQASRYEAWSQALGTKVENGQDYYKGYKELLKKRVGHDVNIWYFPTAFNWPILNGGTADEAFCTAQLKFMADDLINEKYQGGLALYTYYSHKEDRIAFAQRCDISNKIGKYTRYPEIEKWTNYCKVLREIKLKFDSAKAKTIDLKL